MAAQSTAVYRFGDLLALARQSWIAQMARDVAAQGYPDYRRTDAAVLRLLRRGPVSIGRLGDALGVTRQAARKVAAGLEQRGLADAVRDELDARQLNIVLTEAGMAYADAVIAAINRLNRRLARRVSAEQLAAADAVLRAALADQHTRTVAAFVPPPADASS